ncbi:MAG: secretion-associated protein EspG [Nocardia sp.]|uniref:ESX secretion-associated protein EspG n=1 Tax=Nocardia sp. TaxID=1821 RepID=UPI0026057EE0|nr:ESX secretion-associated protein EspG [Nocardia sp.]MCU1643439.1 secretion-associated protein EspG [Nocardia sp.]
MTASWQFAEAEFYVLWMDQTGEEPPEPFAFTSATRTPEDFHSELREARRRLNHKLDSDFHRVFDTLSHPDLYLTAYGWSQQDPWGADSQIRVRAVRKGPKGYVISQLPGATYWRRGGYTVVECDPLQLSDAVAAAMPSAPRGRRGDLALASRDENLDYDFGHSGIAARSDSPISRSAEFLETPITTAGVVHIVQGSSVFGPRGIARFEVRFRDLADDGRYAITSNPEQALAVDEPRFASVLDDYIAAVIQRIDDERG